MTGNKLPWPGAWRCGVCGYWIELREPQLWPDCCGQRAEWISARDRTREAISVR